MLHPIPAGKVLLVDRDRPSPNPVRRALATHFSVIEVREQAEALEVLGREVPDVVICEAPFPCDEAIALVRAMRAEAGTKHVPALLLCDADGDDARLEGLAAGADDCIMGTLEARELVARVAGFVALSRARRELGHNALDDALTETLRLRMELARDLEAMKGLHAFGTRLMETAELDNMLEEILAATVKLQGADFGNIRMMDTATGTLPIAVHQGFAPEFARRFHVVHPGDGSACALALEAGKRVVIEDVRSDPRYSKYSEVAEEAGFRTVQATPLFGRDRKLIGMLSTHFRQVRPFSERELRLTDLYATVAAGFIQRKQNEEALRRADQRKDEFIATLAHELRNPLAPLVSGLDVIARALANDERLARTTRMMDRQLTHLVRLVDDLLDVGRITSGKVQLRSKRIALCNVIDSAVESTRDALQAHRHELVIDRGLVDLHVFGDADRLTQVFSNLLSNAIKYTPRGGRIRVVMRADEGFAVVSVIDTGIGIPPSELPQVFDLFTQVRSHQGQAEGGLGIGLSLVRSLVSLHGGEVRAESAGTGQGSRFIVRLPLHAAVEAEADGGSASKPVPSGALRVLIVDDNVDAAIALGMALESEGYAPSVAHDGVEALEKAREAKPDVVLMDIGMPRMDGLEAARQMRRSAIGDRVYLVALTGWGQERDREMTREAGFDAHLVKPVRVSALRDVFAKVPPRT
jgi:signal transduction histidine kinase/DNA-binding response OmpR family regulator